MGDRIDVRTAAAGRWRAILLSLGVNERALSGKHGPCPLCGGRDRFRFDDKDGCHRPAHRSHLMIGTMEPGRDRHIGATP